MQCPLQVSFHLFFCSCALFDKFVTFQQMLRGSAWVRATFHPVGDRIVAEESKAFHSIESLLYFSCFLSGRGRRARCGRPPFGELVHRGGGGGAQGRGWKGPRGLRGALFCTCLARQRRARAPVACRRFGIFCVFYQSCNIKPTCGHKEGERGGGRNHPSSSTRRADLGAKMFRTLLHLHHNQIQ